MGHYNDKNSNLRACGEQKAGIWIFVTQLVVFLPVLDSYLNGSVT